MRSRYTFNQRVSIKDITVAGERLGGMLGTIYGISMPEDPNGDVFYSVMMDEYELCFSIPEESIILIDEG